MSDIAIERATAAIAMVIGDETLSPSAKSALQTLVASVYAAGFTDGSLKHLEQILASSVDSRSNSHE